MQARGDFQNAVRQYQAHSESLSLSSRADRELAEARHNGDYELFSPLCSGFRKPSSCGLKTRVRREASPRPDWHTRRPRPRKKITTLRYRCSIQRKEIMPL